MQRWLDTLWGVILYNRHPIIEVRYADIVSVVALLITLLFIVITFHMGKRRFEC